MVKIINGEVGFFAMGMDGTSPAFRVLFLKNFYSFRPSKLYSFPISNKRDLKNQSQNVILCALFVYGSIWWKFFLILKL